MANNNKVLKLIDALDHWMWSWREGNLDPAVENEKDPSFETSVKFYYNYIST